MKNKLLNTTDTSTTTSMLTQEDRKNVNVNKENLDSKEDYITISQEPRRKKVKVKTEKVNISLKYSKRQHN